jgi:AcrR family transcriptional regulator
MPKQVDHAERRATLARAALRLCAREGLAAVTVGLVAREAGISKGLVQHYFPAKADLLRATAETMRADVERAMAEAVQVADGPLDMLRRTLLGLVDLAANEPVLRLAGHAFLAQAGADPAVRSLYRDGALALHTQFAGLVDQVRPRPGVDPVAEAHALLGLADSLADSVLVGATPRAAAETIIDYHLTRLA